MVGLIYRLGPQHFVVKLSAIYNVEFDDLKIGADLRIAFNQNDIAFLNDPLEVVQVVSKNGNLMDVQ